MITNTTKSRHHHAKKQIFVSKGTKIDKLSSICCSLSKNQSCQTRVNKENIQVPITTEGASMLRVGWMNRQIVVIHEMNTHQFATLFS
ncbi:hypothetical protein QL285_093485 [Trifolium repens]|nr:hypothetical protein QL285_093485 [Trifolium repens]